MLTQVEARYTLFDSLEEMLLPESLSSLLSKRVSKVEHHPMDNHNGAAGGRLSYVDTDNGRYVLKRMSIESDWVMYATGDRRGRSVKLWQYGLLDRLLPHVEHQTIACARDGEGWAILMNDLTGGLFSWNQPTAVNFSPLFLDALAHLHATFWNDPLLHEDRIGLCSPASLLNGSSLPVARNRPDTIKSPIPIMVVEGWEIMEKLLDKDVFEQMHKLIKDPRPVFAALDRCPFTLLHGDYRDGNLAILPLRRPVAYDWQFAARSLMTIDLAWFVREGAVRAQEHRYYRERLETYLQQKFDDERWETLVDLGYLFEALRVASTQAYLSKHDSDPNRREFEKIKLLERNRQVRHALRWL
jgi:hypothetical protein